MLLDDCSPVSTPVEPRLMLSVEGGPTTEDERATMQRHPVQVQGTCRISYLAYCSVTLRCRSRRWLPTSVISAPIQTKHIGRLPGEYYATCQTPATTHSCSDIATHTMMHSYSQAVSQTLIGNVMTNRVLVTPCTGGLATWQGFLSAKCYLYLYYSLTVACISCMNPPINWKDSYEKCMLCFNPFSMSQVIALELVVRMSHVEVAF